MKGQMKGQMKQSISIIPPPSEVRRTKLVQKHLVLALCRNNKTVLRRKIYASVITAFFNTPVASP